MSLSLQLRSWFSSDSILGESVCVLVTQSCLTLSDPMDCGPPASSVHGILQARILEWIAIPFSRGSSRPRAHTQASRIAGIFLTIWATREAPESLLMSSMLRATSGSPWWEYHCWLILLGRFSSSWLNLSHSINVLEHKLSQNLSNMTTLILEFMCQQAPPINCFACSLWATFPPLSCSPSLRITACWQPAPSTFTCSALSLHSFSFPIVLFYQRSPVFVNLDIHLGLTVDLISPLMLH